MDNLGDLFGAESVIKPGNKVEVNGISAFWLGCMESDRELIFRHAAYIKQPRFITGKMFHLFDKDILIVKFEGILYTKDNKKEDFLLKKLENKI